MDFDKEYSTYKRDPRGRRSKPEHKSEMTLDGKLQPQDKELEDAVLGALMLEKDAYSIVCDILKPESFYDTANQKIYAAISELGMRQQPIDMLTVTQQLRTDGMLDEVGGPVHISELTANVASAAHIEYHARIIAQKSLARNLINFCSRIQEKAFDESYDVDDLLQEAEGQLFEISQGNLKKDFTQIDPVINTAIEQIESAAKRENGLSGLETGFHELDKLTSGWQNSDLIIIAARPAMGKTAFVLSMAKNMSVDYNIPVQLNSRLRKLYGAPLFIDDTPSLSIFELRTKARRLVREHNVKAVIIDYLQLMNASGMKFGSREQEVSMISRSLKQLAKELNIPIIALSQLSRKVEDRNDNNKRPQLSDLRESGAIEQDADIVCFIHRPEYYTRSAVDANNRSIRGLAEFIVAKHRSGSVADVEMTFIAKYARFQNREEDYNYVQETIDSRLNSSERSEYNPADSDDFDFANRPGMEPEPDFLHD